MKYETICFDFDGVIGNTIEDNFCAREKAFGEHGFPLAGKNISCQKE